MIQHDEFGPEKIVEVYDAKTGMRGVLVIDNTALGPGKGGIRMTPTVSTEEVFRLARTMTWKTAIAELPFGGAKSGIMADPKKITKEQKHELIRAFSRAIKPLCPSRYIAAPDINTTEEDMEVFAKENGSLRSATGKPSNLCETPGRFCGIPHEFGSTGIGVAHATKTAAEFIGVDLNGATVAIEGFGNVGSFAAESLQEMGAKIVAVSDSRGCIYNADGLDAKRLIEVKKSGSVTAYRPGNVIKNEDIFTLDVDILIPAALPDVINESNVNSVKAKIVTEAANIPMKPEIEQILFSKNVLVIPDFVANAGGVISSYAEYRGYHPKEMFKMVENKIRKNTELVLKTSAEKKIKPRDAAMDIAMERVRSAMRLA